MTAPSINGESSADRLMRSIDYRLNPEVAPLSREQVAVVVRAMADHTAIVGALEFDPPADGFWPQATSVGRWYHAVADQLEQSERAPYRAVSFS